MLKFEDLYKQILDLETLKIQDQIFQVKNCVVGMDQELLKISLCLISDSQTITVFSEVKDHPKKK